MLEGSLRGVGFGVAYVVGRCDCLLICLLDCWIGIYA